MTREEWLRQEIEAFRKKIQTYQSFIAEYEQQLGLTVTLPTQTTAESGRGKPASTPNDDYLAVVPGMIFFGKSQPEAAKMLLERVGYPLTTPQIIAGIEKGGLKVGGGTEKARKTNLYTILNRSSEFGRVRRDTWGLIGWSGVSKKTADEDNGPEKDSEKD